MAEAKQRHLSSVRRLAAIMFTDIVGYTKMMSKDEQDTLTLLRTNRETHRKLILDFGGQFLKEMGDGILASFENSSDAVVCAAAIQKASKENKIELRIGIHMGEVTFENKDVFGDGVNIASRIQPLAEPNQILISETVHHNVQNKPGITSQLLGERELKNVMGAKAIYIVEVDDNYLTPRLRDEEKKSLSPLIMAIVAIAIIGLGVVGGYFLGIRSQDLPAEIPVIRYEIDLDAPLWRTGRHALAFSPDGKYLCYTSNSQLFLKSMDDTGNGLPIAGVNDPREPSFSPDGNWIAFEDANNAALMKISVTGGKALKICSLDEGTQGINWYDDGIIFGMDQAFYKVNANGGVPEKIYPLNKAGFTSDVWNPQILPDKNTIIFSQYSEEDVEDAFWDVRMVKLDSDNEPDILIDRGEDPRYLGSGHIAYLQDELLYVVPIDVDSKKIGTSQPLTSDNISTRNGRDPGQFAFNHYGTFVYSVATRLSPAERHLVWIDFDGNIERITREPAMFMSQKISGDGQQIVTDFLDEKGLYHIAIYNPTLGTGTNFVSAGSTMTPVWSPDNVSISYSQISDPFGVFTKPIDMSYPEKHLFTAGNANDGVWSNVLGNWSNDGRYLTFTTYSNIGYFDRKDSTVNYLDFINQENNVYYPALSPDGKWLSYASFTDGESHVYVVPFPGPGQANRISVDEGGASVWAPDMSSIYFIGTGKQDNRVTNKNTINVSKADIQTTPRFSSSVPEVLFYGDYTTTYRYGNGLFDIHPDGNRFLMQEKVTSNEESAGSDDSSRKLQVVVNWPGLLDDQ